MGRLAALGQQSLVLPTLDSGLVPAKTGRMLLRTGSESRVNESNRDPGYGDQENSSEGRQKATFTSRSQVKYEYCLGARNNNCRRV